MAAIDLSISNSFSPDQISAELRRASLPAAPEVPVNEWRIDNRLMLDPSQLALAAEMLDLARYQQINCASPVLSNFKVGGAGYLGDQKFSLGQNSERGAGPGQAADDAIHGEDAVVSHAKTLHGSSAKLSIVAVTTDAPNPASSCGRCRGALETDADGDLVLLSGGMNGDATMWRLSELLPGDFPGIGLGHLEASAFLRIQKLLDAATTTAQDGFQPFTQESLGHSGVAVMADGNVFSMPRVDIAAFYGISSLAATMSAVFKANPRELQAVMIVGKTGLPVAEDRQILYEIANIYGCSDTLDVYMNALGSSTVRHATPAQLLPNAFGPRDLGLDLSNYLEKRPRIAV